MTDGLRLKLHSGRDVKVVYQTEAAECGLACLAMVAGWHGLQTDMPALRRIFPHSRRGMNLERLIALAARVGLQCRALRLEPADLRKLALPCVLHWEMNHFVVLVRVLRNGILVHDPAFGRRKLGAREVDRSFTGVAVEFSRAVDFVQQKSPVRGISLAQMIGPVRGVWTASFKLFLLSIGLQAIAMIAPLLMQGVMDQVIVSNDRDLLMLIVLGLLVVLLLQVAIGSIRAWSILRLSSVVGIQWIGSVVGHLLRLPMGFFEKRHLGDIVSRIASVSALQDALTVGLVGLALDGLMAIVSLGMMISYSVPAACLSLISVTVYGVIRVGWYGPLRLANEEQLIRNAKESSHLIESVRGIQSLKLSGKVHARHSAWLGLAVASLNQNVAVSRIGLVLDGSSQLVFGVERIALVGLGAWLVLERQFSVGMLIAYMSYKDQFVERMGGLIDGVIELRMLRIHSERLGDIVLTAPECGRKVHQEMVSSGDYSLEADGLGFRYGDDGAWVLRGCSFRIRQGEVVAIVGASGCGKTTLVKLLLGLLVPAEGEVRLGGVCIDSLSLDSYRAEFGVVMQDDQLFAGTVLDNIVFFDPNGCVILAERAARLAAIHDEIEAMTMGYQTLVGELGIGMSGGQKQRLLLARALYRNPKIIVLDEATSHLDVLSERLVNDSIQGMSLTRIIIAHRPETIAMADRVLTLEDGFILSDVDRGAVCS